MPAFDVVQRWKGRVAVARDGVSLGPIVEVFYDAESDQPGWALLVTDVDQSVEECSGGDDHRFALVAIAVFHRQADDAPVRHLDAAGPGQKPGGAVRRRA